MFGVSKIQLSDHFTYKRLAIFALPSIMMMLFASLYGVADGIIIANYTDTERFAAINLILPYIMILDAIGLMLGTGGSALIAKTLGEQNQQKADRFFSLLTYFAVVISVIFGVVGIISTRTVAEWLGAKGQMVDFCYEYGSILFAFLPTAVLQLYFQSLLVTAERPNLGLWLTVVSGLTNIVLDIVFIIMLPWGLKGAAWATGISQVIGGVIPLFYFVYKRKDQDINLHLGKFNVDIKAIINSCSNGLSEAVMSVALAFVSMIYLYKLMEAKNAIGVDAYGLMLYFAYMFTAVFTGFGRGIAPIVSYHYGADNKKDIKDLLDKGLYITGIMSLAITIFAQALAYPLADIFVGYDTELLNLTVYAFRFYSLHFLFTGFNIYISAIFTALNNGRISALISLSRTLVFESGSVLLLTYLWGIDAIWYAVAIAEGITCVMAFGLLWQNKHYWSENKS